MAQCSNCQSQLGCSCQIRKASNGASVCANCIQAYEHKIMIASNEQKNNK